MRHWVQITSGRGPAECAWAVTRVLRELCDEGQRAGLTAELLESVPGPFNGTLDSALLAVEGADGALDEFLTGWTGTILWIGQSPFRPQYKRKNWFVGVTSLGVPRRVAWSEKELVIDTMRASGPGGQHVNKTESAVRITHEPTGLSVTAREERSQQANRKLALARLGMLFAERDKQNQRAVQQQRWSQHNALERGNAIRVYEGPKFKLRE